MSTVAWPLQVALVSALEADGPLIAILAGDQIYSGTAPEGSAFPYLTLGDSTEGDFNAIGRNGNEGTETIHIWSRVAGKQEVLTIWGHIERILNRKKLTLSAGEQLSGFARLVTVIPDPDGKTTHGVVIYRSLARG